MELRKMKKAELLDLAERLAEDNQRIRDTESSLYRQIERWKQISNIAFVTDAVCMILMILLGFAVRSNLLN